MAKRGEYKITIGDKELTLRFSFGAIFDIEEAFGEPIVKRFSTIDEQNPMAAMRDLVVMFREASKAGGTPVDDEWLKDNMVLTDIQDYMKAMTAGLSVAATPEASQGNVPESAALETPPTGTLSK